MFYAKDVNSCNGRMDVLLTEFGMPWDEISIHVAIVCIGDVIDSPNMPLRGLFGYMNIDSGVFSCGRKLRSNVHSTYYWTFDNDQLENMFKDDIYTLLHQCLSTAKREYAVPQCLSPRPNWVRPTPLPQASPPPEPKGVGEQHSPSGEGVGRPNSDDWRESLVLPVHSVVHCMGFCKPSLNALQGHIFLFVSF